MHLFDVRLVLTKEDIIDGLHRAQLRRASKGRLIAQTIALALVGAWSSTAFILGGMKEAASLFITLAAVVLIPVMWFVPEMQIRSIAQDMVEEGKAVRLWVFEDGVDFGEEQPDYAYYPYHTFSCYHPKEGERQTLVMRFANDDIVIVPKALLTEEQWDLLCEKTQTP